MSPICITIQGFRLLFKDADRNFDCFLMVNFVCVTNNRFFISLLNARIDFLYFTVRYAFCTGSVKIFSNSNYYFWENRFAFIKKVMKSSFYSV